MLEIQNDTDSQIRDPKIIQHQSAFVIRYLIDHLRVHHNCIKSNQVRDEQADVVPFVEDVEWRLLSKRNFPQAKLHRQCIFIRLLDNSMAKRIQNLNGARNNLKDFFFE